MREREGEGENGAMEQEEEEEGAGRCFARYEARSRGQREKWSAPTLRPPDRPTEGRTDDEGGEQSQGQRHPPPCASVVRASVRPRCGGAIHSWMDGSGSPLYLMLRGSLLHRNLRPHNQLSDTNPKPYFNLTFFASS